MPGSLDATDSSRPTISCSHWDSPCGRLLIASFNDKLVMNDWEQSRRHQEIMRRLQRRLGADFIEARSPKKEKAVIELQEYFSGKRKTFDVDLLLVGSPFQLSVWQAISAVPYGSQTTYAGIAAAAGFPRAVRAAGTAVGSNPLSIIIGCHRVLASSSTKLSYGGGAATKKFLLDLEGISLARQKALSL